MIIWFIIVMLLIGAYSMTKDPILLYLIGLCFVLAEIESWREMIEDRLNKKDEEK